MTISTVDHLKYVIEQQMAEIDRLRAELDNLVAWVMGDRDALSCLQRTYNDASASEANRVKAAAAAIGFERAKVATAPSVVVIDFRERVRQARLKAPLVEPKTIEHIP